MKSKARLFIWIFLAVCLCCSFGCSTKDKETGWSPEIEIVDGIKVITNPEESKYGEFAFELEEDLAIGDVDDEGYSFWSRVTLSADNEGNIYVVNGGKRRVQKYNKDGIYVKTIGRQGQGPGEYMYPSKLFLDDAGNPVVEGNRSLLYYDQDGVFQKQISLKGSYMRLILGPKNTFIGSTQPNALVEGGAKTSIVLIGENGEPIQTIAESPVSFNTALKATVLHWYTNTASFAPRTSGSFYYGFSTENRIIVADSEGRTMFTFKKTAEPQTITGEEKELTIKDGIYLISGTKDRERAIAFPDHRPYFGSFFSDDVGHLYVIRFKSILEREDKMIRIDVFSKDGIYLYEMNWSFMPALIKNGFLYEVRENEETGYSQIIRHKIVNRSKFKEE